MARSSQIHEGVPGRSKEQPAAGQHNLAVLGRTPAQRETAVRSATPAKRPCGRITATNVLQLLEWQGYRCALTGRLLTPETASLDHIVPVRHGGEHRIENVQVLHKEVNRAKSTMTNEEFVQLCREVVDHAATPGTKGEKP
jgi:5-methylcytosine-specific restriction endonuclease McrA